AKRYAGDGSNNGRLPYSVREAAAEFRIGKTTASRALDSLEAHGFIVPVTKGAFSLKKRHATEWRLTEFPCDVTHAISTKDFMRWKSGPRNLERDTGSGTVGPGKGTEGYFSSTPSSRNTPP